MTWALQAVHVTLVHRTGDKVKCQFSELKELVNSSRRVKGETQLEGERPSLKSSS